MGDGTTTDRSSAAQVKGEGGIGYLNKIIANRGGGDSYHSLAAKNDGTAWGWGYNGVGQLGIGIVSLAQSTPVKVLGYGGVGYLTGVTAVAAGGWTGGHSLAVVDAVPVEDVPAAAELRVNGSSGGDPVATLTGSYTYPHVDVAIAGRGPAPSFVRSYNSGDTRVGVLGPGWTHDYLTRLTHPSGATLDLNLVMTSGASTRFTRNLDGSSQITGVSDPAGRGSLSFGYDPTTGRLTSVTDWLSPARSVQFTYDGNGRLWKVTDREGKVTTYGYDGTSPRLKTITDARGNVAITNVYDGQGRVQSQKDARGLATGQQTTFSYVTNPDNTKTTTVTYPPTSYDPAWSPTVADTYDTNGWLTSKVSRATASETATEQFGYDASGRRTSATDARGNTTNFCYDVDYAGAAIAGGVGNLTRRIDPPPTAGANRPVTLFKYDSKNNLIETIPPLGVNNGTSVDCTTDLSGAINTGYAGWLTVGVGKTTIGPDPAAVRARARASPP